jgi:hypothetical protein
MKAVANIQPIVYKWFILISKKILLLLGCLLVYSTMLFSQEENKKNVKFSGSANITDNFYSASGIAPRQPGNMLTGIIRANLTLFDQIELPFELYLSTEQTRFQQPFNQFGVSPKISDWLTLHAGYFSTRISDFTFGDLRMLGGGFELTPGKFRLKAIYGRTRKASESDIKLYLPGIYRQNSYAISIGYGDESKAFLNFNVFHALDDPSSIKKSTFQTAPNENFVSSVSFGVKMGKKVFLNGETAISAFTSNTAAEKAEKAYVPSFLMTSKTSTQLNRAVKLNLNITPSGYWFLMLSTQWIGPGFTSLGYALMPADLFEFNIAPTFRMFKNKFNLRAKAGMRYNNLHDNKLASTRRFTGMLSANWQVSKTFGLDANYNKNQIKSSHVNDTLRLSNIYNSISVSPRFTFDSFGGSNYLIFTFSQQNVSDKNVYTSKVTDNLTNSISAVHTIAFVSSLSLSTTMLYNSTKLSELTNNIFNVSETVGRRFINSKLSTSASLGVNYLTSSKSSSSSQIVFRINATYSFKKSGNLSFNLSNSGYSGKSGIVQHYNELFGNIQYNINF